MNSKKSFILGSLLGIVVTAIAFATVNSASAHSGGTDSNGGHYNRKTGEYHYHNGGKSKGRSNSDSNSSGWYDPSPEPAPEPEQSIPRTRVYTSFDSGNCEIRLFSDDTATSGEWKLKGRKYDSDSAPTYTIYFTLDPGENSYSCRFTVTREEVLEMLGELCAIYEAIREPEPGEAGNV